MWPEAVIVIHVELAFVFTLPCRSLSVKFDGTLLWQVSAASSAIFPTVFTQAFWPEHLKVINPQVRAFVFASPRHLRFSPFPATSQRTRGLD